MRLAPEVPKERGQLELLLIQVKVFQWDAGGRIVVATACSGNNRTAGYPLEQLEPLWIQVVPMWYQRTHCYRYGLLWQQ